MDPELVVKFKGDLTEWSQSIAKAKADLSSLSVGMNGTLSAQNRFSKGTSDSTRANEQLIASMNSLGRKMKEVANQTTSNTEALKVNSSALINNKNNNEQALGGIGNLAKGYLSLAAVMKAGQMFLDSTREVQKFENQLKVASGTQEQYGKNTQFLEGLAARYNKNVLDLGANFAQLTIATRGTNLEGEKTERLFAAVTATSAALQMSVDDTNGTFRAFIQMVSKGNVQAEELRGQLGERLYGAFNLAAKSMGVTTAELNKMLEKGEVLAGDLLPKLTTELEKSFGADAEKNAKNLGSAIEYSTGQISLLIAELGKSSGTTSFLSNMATDAGTLLNQLRLINKEKGVTGVVLGLMDSGAETLLNGTGFEGPTLKRARELQKSVNWQGSNSSKINGQGNVINSLTGEYRDTSFGLPSSIRAEAGDNSAATEKAKKAAEAAARKADVIMNRWVAEQIKLSNDRLRDALQDSSAQLDGKYRTNNSDLNTPGMAKSTGMGLNYNYGSDQFNKEFSNQTTGDGSATNYDHIIAGMDDAIKQIQAKGAKLKHVTDDIGEQLNDSMNQAFGSAIVSMVEGVGNLAVGLANGTSDMADVGNAFMGIMATMFDNIGKALAAHAATLILAKASISTMNIAGSLAGAALAFGAGAVARAAIADSSQGAFWTGGIVPRKGGLDGFPIMATGGEMVLNSGQQKQMFGILDGAMSGQSFSGNSRGSSQRSEVVGELRGIRMSSGDIGFSAKVGEKKNNYFRSKR